MSQPKKPISVSLPEPIIMALNEWKQICHDENLLINRSDLIGILLMTSLEQLEADTREVSCLNTIVQDLAVTLKDYYTEYDLALRREDGVHD